MKSPNFEIYHFNDSRSCNIRLHHHDFFELYYLRAGKMDYIVDGQRYTLHPGSLLFITPDQLHRPDIIGEDIFERFVLWINPAFMSSALEFLPNPTGNLFSGAHISNLLIPDEKQREVIETQLTFLHQESQSSQEHHTLMCHTLLVQLLIHIKRMMLQLPQTNAPFFVAQSPAKFHPASKPSDEDLRQVFSYIQNHLCEDLTVAALSQRFYFNTNTLSRLFKKHAGIPIGEYVRKKRLAAARLHIYQGMNVLQAGTASGFSDYSTFYRAFRHEYGVSPKDFALSCHKQP